MARDAFFITMGTKIAQQQKDQHLTQEQLADLMGVSLQTLSYIELGEYLNFPDNISQHKQQGRAELARPCFAGADITRPIPLEEIRKGLLLKCSSPFDKTKTGIRSIASATTFRCGNGRNSAQNEPASPHPCQCIRTSDPAEGRWH